MVFFLFSFFLAQSVYWFSNKKVLLLLTIEIIYMVLLCLLIISGQCFVKSMFLLFVLSVMMVVDSVFFISVLVSCGRGSTFFNPKTIFYF